MRSAPNISGCSWFVDGAHHVVPHPGILAENCFQCHGPDENKREADLRLDTPENVFQDRDGYSVIVPGDLQSSELFLRMTAKDESKRMPPADAERTVTDRKLLLIRRWIQRAPDGRTTGP